MKTKYILGMILSAAVLLTGCMKEDVDELRRQQAENAGRIAALEQWQSTVNGQISAVQELVTALENYDYVTGVTPVIENGVEVGYTITFAKSNPITIRHGAKGDKGDTGATGQTGATGRTPAIGVKDFPAGSGTYYWTLDGEFITHDGTPGGNKMPVRGEKGEDGLDGKTPKVGIGADGFWYISPDGTATGDLSAGDYTGWTPTNVKAKGDQGDAIFAANGVDNSDPDFVVFTLAGPPATKIKLPKYKDIGISFSQPGAFIIGQDYRVAYTSTGSITPTDIRVDNIPAGWLVTVDKSAGEFVITPPADFSAAGVQFGKATIWLDNGSEIAKMYNIELQNRRISGNVVGGIYYDNGVAAGTIYIANDGTPGSGRVYTSQYPSLLVWDDGNYDVPANSRTDGLYNTKVIADFINNSNGVYSWSNFPVFEWINSKNPENTAYNSGLMGIWYLPALDELETLKVITGATSQWSWSSTSEVSTKAWCLINIVGQSNDDKNIPTWSRAICRF